jgi:hypothetical protein
MMSIVTYGVVSPQLTLDVKMELSDTDSARIVQYLIGGTGFGSVNENVQSEVPNPAWSPDQKDPNDPPQFIQQQAWVSRPATPEEAVQAYARATMDSLLQSAFQWDQARAAAAAAAEVPPITPILPPTSEPGK